MKKLDIYRYTRLYAGLLQLYPRAFRRRFAEPMLQTFGDMCHESAENGENLGVFTLKMCLETLVQIIKERYIEVVMNIKNGSKKAYVFGGVFAAILPLFLYVMLRDYRGVRTIPPNSTIEQARELSKGVAEPCLAENGPDRAAIKKDDNYLGDGEQFSMFEIIVASGIIDVPAGTEVDIRVNSYVDRIAKGSALYAGDYGSYNYELKYLGTKPGEWELQSLKACDSSK
ncbi:hypothetical protein KDA00_04855 [Candidatus Saccharibacteria bacterium]|nr:hypothetical protein [Candidatus Saccharibacteria bacterium]